MSGWVPGGVGSGGSTGPVQPGSPQLPFIPGSYDDIKLAYDPISQNLIQVQCYRLNVLIVELSLSYDINDNLVEVEQV
jgi:hypothetical protein